MKKLLSTIHTGLAWLAVAAIAAQFLFAGLGIFGAASFRAHALNGYLTVLASLILALLALAGRLGRARIGLSALLFGLTIVQALLPKGPPLIAALHPLTALAVLGVAVSLARVEMTATGRPKSAGRATDVGERPMSREQAI